MFTVGKDIVIFDEAGKVAVRITDPVMRAKVEEIPCVDIMRGENQVIAMLPWTEDACRVFQNLGIDMTGAAPLWTSNVPLVEGKFSPMRHQLFTAAFMTLNPRCYILSDPRTGKTGAFIIGIDYMQKQRMLTGGILIVTTVTTMYSVWYDSIRATLPDAIIEVVHGKERERALSCRAEFYITNYDSIRLSRKAFIAAAKAGYIAAVGIDEMTHVGNTSSQRHKAIDELCNKVGLNNIIGITGSPGENVETVFGMARIVNRHKLPCTTKSSWIDMTTYQYGPERFMRRMSPNAPKIIHETLQPAVRFNKADIIDLPPVVVQNRECVMSKEQASIREQFKQQAVALVKSGAAITAVNGGVLHQKLMQVAQGFVMDNSGKPEYLDYKDRLKTILECIDETTRKVVIFSIYKAAIERLVKDLRAAGHTAEIVDGSTTGKVRADILRRFQKEKNPRVLICHPTTTAFGVELSAADTIIFAGPPQLGGFIYAQALERLSSVKQTANKISIIRIVSSPEEKKAYAALDNGRKVADVISELFEDYARGSL